MFSRIKFLTATATLLACVPGAFAASTVELTVKGLITPSACTPSLSKNGVIDHGKISVSDLAPDRHTIIGNDVLSLSVLCDASTLIALRAIDNRAGTAIGTTNNKYGIGLVDGKKLGGYFLTWSNSLADSVPAQSIGSEDQGQTWYREWIWYPNTYMSAADPADLSTPIAMQKLDVELGIQTIIDRTDGLDLSNEVPIDGSATLEVVYL